MQHLVRLSFADDETAGRSANCLETVFFYGGMTSLKIITFEQSTMFLLNGNKHGAVSLVLCIWFPLRWLPKCAQDWNGQIRAKLKKSQATIYYAHGLTWRRRLCLESEGPSVSETVSEGLTLSEK